MSSSSSFHKLRSLLMDIQINKIAQAYKSCLDIRLYITVVCDWLIDGVYACIC